MSFAFATLEDIQERHPREIAVLAADEETRTVDPVRVTAACTDASMEVRSILAQRYTSADLERAASESLGLLKLYTIDIALYRVALSFSRSTEQLKERYETAIKRLTAIACGKGALEILSGGSGSSGEFVVSGPINPFETIIVSNERLFTRRRFAGGQP